MTLKEREKQFSEDFDMFESWDEKYEYIMSLGAQLPKIPEDHKNETTRVAGCQSASWLEVENRDGKLYYRGDSEAILGKGVISLLLNIINGSTPEEVLAYDFDLIKKIKLKEHLSPTRQQGLESVMSRIKELAKNYSHEPKQT